MYLSIRFTNGKSISKIYETYELRDGILTINRPENSIELGLGPERQFNYPLVNIQSYADIEGEPSRYMGGDPGDPRFYGEVF